MTDNRYTIYDYKLIDELRKNGWPDINEELKETEGPETTEPESEEIPENEYTVFSYDEYEYIKILVPGFGKDDIDAYLTGNTLVIEGEKLVIKETALEIERNFNIPRSFRNAFTLSSRIKIDCIIVENGICTIQMSRTEEEKTYIEVG